MPIVFACAGSHAPGITAWTEKAPREQVDRFVGGYNTVQRELAASRPDSILLLTSEHWANFFLDTSGPSASGAVNCLKGRSSHGCVSIRRSCREIPNLRKRFFITVTKTASNSATPKS